MPFTFTLNKRTRSSSFVVSIVPTCAMPALFTRMSITGMVSVILLTSACCLTSHLLKKARPPELLISSTTPIAFSSISRICITLPCLPNSKAMALPIPLPPPVITEVLFSRLNILTSVFLYSLFNQKNPVHQPPFFSRLAARYCLLIFPHQLLPFLHFHIFLVHL